jgi:beta-mannosidase
MFDQWKLMDFGPSEGITANAFAEDFDDSSWLDIAVPGDVHTALIAAKRIPQPFIDRNEDACRWVEDREWWYRLTFTPEQNRLQDDERLQLVFHGLDTFAAVWLNGELIGEHANMFREAVFDVTQRLRIGQPNSLAVRFDPPMSRIAGQAPPAWGLQPERIPMRKAQFGYGWDWGPRLPTVGIWRPVELRRHRQAALRGVHFATIDIDPACQHALARIYMEIDPFAVQGELNLQVRLIPPGQDSSPGAVIEQQVESIHDSSATMYFDIKQPILWWTHDLGYPSLYTLEVMLYSNEELVDVWQSQVGIRTIKLDQSPDPDERGTRFFRFVLNGVPIFTKGADWIPADSFVGAIQEDQYARLLTMARDANMNMLRIWGGGIYEHDAFYNLCDRLGILIWHDFMFACAPYPETAEFAAEVSAEAEYQVRRLRNHPSMALWCGNNENQWIHDLHNWNDPHNVVPGALYYNKILPETVSRWDGVTPYWPGSPYGGDDYNSQQDGDVHDWNVWHGMSPRRFGEQPQSANTPESVSYKRYAEDLGRFISEFGMHASPVAETLRRVIPPDQLYHHSPSLDHHNKDNPKNKGDNLMLPVTGLPTNLEEMIDFSMIAQAEGLKFGIEHFRRRKPHCSGTLFWQLNDCWPVLSWSVIDYYGFGKAGYYYARRAYAPVLASFKALPDGGIELWVTNDTLVEVHETAIIRRRSFHGATQWEQRVAVDLPANFSQRVWACNAEEAQATPDGYLAVCGEKGIFSRNRHFFAAIKELQRSKVQLQAEVTAGNEHEVNVTFTAEGYAFFVHLLSPSEDTIFSDNYFDLEAGETRIITVINPELPIQPELLQVHWR